MVGQLLTATWRRASLARIAGLPAGRFNHLGCREMADELGRWRS